MRSSERFRHLPGFACALRAWFRRGSLRSPLRSKRRLVEATGFEPVTPSLQSSCSAKLSYAPLVCRPGFYPRPRQGTHCPVSMAACDDIRREIDDIRPLGNENTSSVRRV